MSVLIEFVKREDTLVAALQYLYELGAVVISN